MSNRITSSRGPNGLFLRDSSLLAKKGQKNWTSVKFVSANLERKSERNWRGGAKHQLEERKSGTGTSDESLEQAITLRVVNRPDRVDPAVSETDRRGVEHAISLSSAGAWGWVRAISPVFLFICLFIYLWGH